MIYHQSCLMYPYISVLNRAFVPSYLSEHSKVTLHEIGLMLFAVLERHSPSELIDTHMVTGFAMIY